jgi:AcrR family transcriptional regulator
MILQRCFISDARYNITRMPKLVDHEARRAALAEAVWRVAQRRGLEDATLREIAAEAGWSTGVLSHYFADKDELVRFAFRLVVERASERYRKAAAIDDPVARIRLALGETLPLDEERLAEAGVWLAFLGRSLSHPGLAEDRKAFYASWRESLAALLEDGRGQGALRAGLDPEAEATGLIALVDGLALQAVSDPDGLPAARQSALLDAAVERLRP